MYFADAVANITSNHSNGKLRLNFDLIYKTMYCGRKSFVNHIEDGFRRRKLRVLS
jgi:hypothetical protein